MSNLRKFYRMFPNSIKSYAILQMVYLNKVLHNATSCVALESFTQYFLLYS